MARRTKAGPEEAIVGLGVGVAVLTMATGHSAVSPSVIGCTVGLTFAVALAWAITKALNRSTAGVPRIRQEPVVPDSPIYIQPRKVSHLDVVFNSRTALGPVAGEANPVWSLDLIRDLEWKRFEELCEGYWQAKGYRAEQSGREADGGIDINLYRPSCPEKILAVIQCKSRSKEYVGVESVRELYGVMHHERAPMGILVTSLDFHRSVREFTAGKHIQLVNGETLLRQIQELPEQAREALRDRVTRGDYITPTCPSCDVKMVWRSKKSTDFYGCSHDSGCRHTMPLRPQHRRLESQI